MIDPSRREILKRRFGTVLLVAGLSWMARADWDIWRVWQTQQWPTSEGVISRAALVNVFHPGLVARVFGGNARSFQVGYEYRVGNHAYESQRIHLLETESRRIPDADAGHYAQGAKVVVHYDPMDVTQAVLETNIPSDHRGERDRRPPDGGGRRAPVAAAEGGLKAAAQPFGFLQCLRGKSEETARCRCRSSKAPGRPGAQGALLGPDARIRDHLLARGSLGRRAGHR